MRRRYIPGGGWLEQNEMVVLKLVAFLVVLTIFLVATGYSDTVLGLVNPDLNNCKQGKCKSSCSTDGEVQKFDVICSDSTMVCCLSKDKVSSDECDGLTKGESCGDTMLCDDTLKCVSKCEYCSRFPLEESCILHEGTYGRQIELLNQRFGCGCTESECSDIQGSGFGTCVKGFCPRTDPTAADYMCCDIQ
jgi:hypothetical protein